MRYRDRNPESRTRAGEEMGAWTPFSRVEGGIVSGYGWSRHASA